MGSYDPNSEPDRMDFSPLSLTAVDLSELVNLEKQIGESADCYVAITQLKVCLDPPCLPHFS